jgi:hypothetical protein
LSHIGKAVVADAKQNATQTLQLPFIKLNKQVAFVFPTEAKRTLNYVPSRILSFRSNFASPTFELRHRLIPAAERKVKAKAAVTIDSFGARAKRRK